MSSLGKTREFKEHDSPPFVRLGLEGAVRAVASPRCLPSGSSWGFMTVPKLLFTCIWGKN